MPLTLQAEASAEPLDLATVRRRLRLPDDYTADDADLTALIVAARKAAEHETGRSLTTQRYDRVLDAFPEAEIELGMPGVGSIVTILYVDTDGVQRTVPPTDYVLDKDNPLGYVLPAAGKVWPATKEDTVNAVRVRFETGFFVDADRERAMLKQWMLARVLMLYRFPEGVVTGLQVSPLPGRVIDSLLDPYRLVRL